MKKLLLVSLSTAALLNYQASAQTTISITGTSGSINLSTTNFFDSQITLTISDTPPADVAGVDLLLRTPDTGEQFCGGLLHCVFPQWEHLLPTVG